MITYLIKFLIFGDFECKINLKKMIWIGFAINYLVRFRFCFAIKYFMILQYGLLGGRCEKGRKANCYILKFILIKKGDIK